MAFLAITSLLLCLMGQPFGSLAMDASTVLASHVVRTAPEGDVAANLKVFVGLSEAHNLGMHLGLEKGALLEASVRRGLPPGNGPAVVLEAGCHAGDSTLSVAAALAGRPGSTIVSTESNREWLDAAKKVVGHATKRMGLTFVPLELQEDDNFDVFLDRLQENHGLSLFDAVVLDHDESLFLPHLKRILARGLLRHGGTVFVDNIKRKASQLTEYIEFTRTGSGNGLETEVTEVSEPYPDAVATSTLVQLSTELEILDDYGGGGSNRGRDS
eukprot:CAMPEP_0172721508 /NCGR_PEP_ID=MMETSP1074-20121228/79230_1 /TAXON_ID=2916 /ORGANISM="Ceratium fusus, Strain PA161109" /LENGTH=270 /DNA_ID=CAMNT_0013547263 /DNA_START=65 /DNA_END=875 /DNA_ORIENTATION=-